jgi:hypothetical protein
MYRDSLTGQQVLQNQRDTKWHTRTTMLGFDVMVWRVKLSVGVTCHAYLLEIKGLFARGSRPGRTLGESVGGIFEMESSDWSNGSGIRYHIFDTRPDTEFKSQLVCLTTCLCVKLIFLTTYHHQLYTSTLCDGGICRVPALMPVLDVEQSYHVLQSLNMVRTRRASGRTGP